MRTSAGEKKRKKPTVFAVQRLERPVALGLLLALDGVAGAAGVHAPRSGRGWGRLPGAAVEEHDGGSSMNPGGGKRKEMIPGISRGFGGLELFDQGVKDGRADRGRPHAEEA